MLMNDQRIVKIRSSQLKHTILFLMIVKRNIYKWIFHFDDALTHELKMSLFFRIQRDDIFLNLVEYLRQRKILCTIYFRTRVGSIRNWLVTCI